MPPRLLPLVVEERMRELARELQQRERIRGITRFGLFFAALTGLLGAAFYALEGTSVPLAVPVVAYLAVAVVAWHRWIRRAVSRVSREQLALYLDEQLPELENAFISGATLGAHIGSVPDWVLDRFHEQLRSATESASLPHLVTGQAYRKLAVNGVLSAFAGLAALVVVMSLWDVDRLADGFFGGLRAVRADFTVEPGSVRLVRGADQAIWLRTTDAEAGKAIRWREAGGPWQSDPLQPGRTGDVYYFQFRNVLAPIDYEIQVGTGRSETYTLSVWVPPEVVRVDLVCRYPDYLGLPPRPVAYEGSVTVPSGSQLEIEVAVNKPLGEAIIVRASDGSSVDLARRDDRLWAGLLDVVVEDTLRIVLEDLDGERTEDPHRYVVNVSKDEPPEIQVRLPRGDDEATALEEIPFAFTVKDDHGLKDYGLRYEIAGSPPVTLSLKPDGAADIQHEAVVDHLLPLEDLHLGAGDFIVWTVWAEDRNPSRDSLDTIGDPYFLEIRPFLRRYSQAVSDQGAQQQGQGEQGDAVQRQKQVMIATWNLRREAHRLDDVEYDTQRNRIVSAQLSVLEEAGMAGPPDARSRELLEELTKEGNAAAAALRDAPWLEPGPKLAEALRHEQRAYRAILRLQPAESQVTQSREPGGGGGGGGRQQRDVDALELAARRDFREEASTVNQQMAETERVRQEIEDLARRQQIINEDISELISEQQDRDEMNEESKRRLEQLLEEQRSNLADLDRLQGDVASRDLDPQQARDARRQLEDARGQMSRSSGHLEQEDLQRARAAGNRAQGALDDVGRQLQQLSRDAAAQRLRELQDRMQTLRDEQNAILEDTKRQEDSSGPKGLEDADREGEALLERKEKLAESFHEFMNEAGELAERAAKSQELMSQRLGDWLRETARDEIYEDIQKGDDYVRYGAWDVARSLEEGIQDRLGRASARLDSVSNALVEDDLSAMARAAQELEDLLARADASGSAGNSPGNEGGSAGGVGADSGSGLSARRPPPTAGQGGGEGGSAGAGWGGADWDAPLRTAEALLPDGSETRRRVTGIREEITALDRLYRRSNLLPHREIVVENVLGPLAEVVKDLRREIDGRLSRRRITTPDSRSVPERYREAVAEYFRTLSELDD